MFENAPIRVIFNQGQGIDLFYKDGAFQHLNDQHKATIATLDRYDYVLDVQGRGVWYIHNNPSEAERARFRTT
jgi:hypothetical protein